MIRSYFPLCSFVASTFLVSVHSDLLYTVSIYFLVIGCAMFAVAFNCADLLHRAFFFFNLFGFVVQGRCLLASGVSLHDVLLCGAFCNFKTFGFVVQVVFFFCASLPDVCCCFHLFSFVAPNFLVSVHSDSLYKVSIYFSCSWLRDIRFCFQLCWFVAPSFLLFHLFGFVVQCSSLLSNALNLLRRTGDT